MTKALVILALVLALAGIGGGYTWGGMLEWIAPGDAQASYTWDDYNPDDGGAAGFPICSWSGQYWWGTIDLGGGVYLQGFFDCYPSLKPSGYGPGGGWYFRG